MKFLISTKGLVQSLDFLQSSGWQFLARTKNISSRFLAKPHECGLLGGIVEAWDGHLQITTTGCSDLSVLMDLYAASNP